MILFANVFIGLTIIIALFQVALALGVPLGEFTMGGKYPGKLPARMRVAAVMQLFILAIFVFMVVVKAGMAFDQFYSIGRIGIWIVVAFFVFGSIVNLSSPSRKEKLVMGPANIIALISTLMVALG